MFSSHLTVGIDEGSALPAGEHLSLLLCEEFVAVSAFVEVVLVLLEEQFKFLHKQSTDDFVLALLKYV